MTNIVYIATSLDGYIAPEDGSLDWLGTVPNPEGDDLGFGEFIKRIDAVVMGRLTFEVVQSCLLYTSPSPRDATLYRMPSSA